MALLRLQPLLSASSSSSSSFSSHFSAHILFCPSTVFLSCRSVPISLSHSSFKKTLTPIKSTTQTNHFSIQQQEVDLEEEDEASRVRILAQNVPWSCSADDIRPLFEKYGTVVNVELSMYNKTRNRGLAFVTMASHQEAVAALTNLEGCEYEGRSLKLAWAKPRQKKVLPLPLQPKQLPIHNLYVANLPFQARAKDLKEFFSFDNSNIVSGEIIFRENPRGSAGYGFVSFNTKDEADAAISTFQGKMFMGRPIRVAHSKKFLREETKASMQSAISSSNLDSDGVQTETPDDV